MWRYIFWVLIFLTGFTQSLYCQQYTISGDIINSRDRSPVEFATISIANNGLWTVSGEAGRFVLKKIPGGRVTLSVHCLGYVTKTLEMEMKGDVSNLVVLLKEDNLALDEVVVTATPRVKDVTTSYIMDRTTLNHAQIMNVSDIASLLPGGKTSHSQLLTSDQRFVLRGKTSEKGNASFGTAIEVDGVRLQNNAAFHEIKGTDLRNISSTNIESVEVVTGIPSVEHGDLSSGLVKFHTKKGRTPLTIELSTTPNIKQAAVSKGILLGANVGALNTSFEHTKSISDPASPYTSYARNAFTVRYSHTLNKSGDMPLSIDAGISGNIGGYDSKADPDAYKDTYLKIRDNSIRGNIHLRWLPNKPWITNLELFGSVNYADKLSKSKINKSSSSSQAAIHSMENGYFIATDYDENPEAPILLLRPGYWYQLYKHDSKPIGYSLRLKADWRKRFGVFSHKLMTGVEFNSSGNRGKGEYYDDMRYAPTWRPYRYYQKPFVNNVAWYVEDNMRLPLNGDVSALEIMAGVRSDMTFIKTSEYGTVQSLSPRFNAKYTFWEKADKTVRDLMVYAGWGRAVKLPSLQVLYPRPVYSDDLAFAPGTMADGSTFYAYYTTPVRTRYNPELKWQKSEQVEVGTKINIAGIKIALALFYSQTVDPYISTYEYKPYSYRLTDQKALESCAIPFADRRYTIDRQTGLVTVSDKTGRHENQPLAYSTRDEYTGNYMYQNGSPIKRIGVEWAVDFPRIPSVKTSFRVDGNYYRYKGVEETLTAWRPPFAMTDNTPFRYVGYYAGAAYHSSSVSNGSLSEEVNVNFTTNTHIPAIRMIFTLRLEASLYKYARRLSEYKGKSYGFVLERPEHYTGNHTDIYRKDVYVGVYPLYYSTWDAPDTKIPFAEQFAWAKENDRDLYNELAKLVLKSHTSYYFNPNSISPYLSANISVTKEIGRYASISFYANNFFNNMAKVKVSNNHTESTLYRSGYIPIFSYGLSLRLKL